MSVVRSLLCMSECAGKASCILQSFRVSHKAASAFPVYLSKLEDEYEIAPDAGASRYRFRRNPPICAHEILQHLFGRASTSPAYQAGRPCDHLDHRCAWL